MMMNCVDVAGIAEPYRGLTAKPDHVPQWCSKHGLKDGDREGGGKRRRGHCPTSSARCCEKWMGIHSFVSLRLCMCDAYFLKPSPNTIAADLNHENDSTDSSRRPCTEGDGGRAFVCRSNPANAAGATFAKGR